MNNQKKTILLLTEDPYNNLMHKWFLESIENGEKYMHIVDIKDTVKININNSIGVVIFLTNTMIQTISFKEWMENVKASKLKSIALLIEEIKYYDQVQNDFDYYFEIYKARFNPTGFDYFLWISDYFENFINLIEKLLNKPLVSLYLY